MGAFAAGDSRFCQSITPSIATSIHVPDAGGIGTQAHAIAAEDGFAGRGFFGPPFGNVAMRTLRIVLPVLAAAGLVALCSSGVRAPGEPATCKEIAADPERWAGRHVLLSTKGCQFGGPDTLVYRTLASKPPAVVIRLARPHNGVMPPKVDGTVASAGPPAVVAGARPVW